jgi:hypothetical protein
MRYRTSEETGQPEDTNKVTRKGEVIEATRGNAGSMCEAAAGSGDCDRVGAWSSGGAHRQGER